MKKIISIMLAAVMAAAMCLSVLAAVTAGDVNGDGEVDNKDVVVLFRTVSGNVIPGFVKDAADINGDGEIDNKDVVKLFRSVSGQSADTPDKPDIPDIPDKPDRPEDPDKPEEPDEPDRPDEPDTEARLVSFSFDNVYVNGAQLCNGGASEYLEENPISGNMMNVGVRGWVHTENSKIDQFGCSIDGGTPVFDAGYLQQRPDVQEKFETDAEYANGFVINPIDVFALENGEHTFKAVVMVEDGTVLDILSFSFTIVRSAPANPAALSAYSFDIIWVNSSMIVSSEAEKYLRENQISGNLNSVGAQGWAALANSEIDQFGYKLDENDPIFSDSYLVNRPDVQSAVHMTAEYANGFTIKSVNVSSLSDGAHTFTVVVKAKDGNVVNVVSFDFTIERSAPAEPPKLVSSSFDAVWIDGDMIVNGKADEYLKENPIKGNISSISFCGWALIANGKIHQFGYKLDDGEIKYDESNLVDRPDVQKEMNSTADYANGYQISSIDVSSLSNGAHTLTSYVKTNEGFDIKIVSFTFTIAR